MYFTALPISNWNHFLPESSDDDEDDDGFQLRERQRDFRCGDFTDDVILAYTSECNY